MDNKEDMTCPRCGVEMTIGIAIDPGYESNCWYRVWPVSVTYDTLQIIDVMKCPECGFSDDGTVQAPKPERVPNIPIDNSQMINSVVKFFDKVK